MQTMTKAKKLWDSPFFSFAKTEKEKTLWEKMTPKQKWEVVGTFFLGIAATIGIIEYAFTPEKKQSSIVEKFLGLLRQRNSQRTESSVNSSSTQVGIGESFSKEVGIDDTDNGWFNTLRNMSEPEDNFRFVFDENNFKNKKPYVFDGHNVQIDRFFSAFLKQGDCFFDAMYSALRYLPKESINEFYDAWDKMRGEKMIRFEHNAVSNRDGKSERFIDECRNALSDVLEKSQDRKIVGMVMVCFRLIGRAFSNGSDVDNFKTLHSWFGDLNKVGGEIYQNLPSLFFNDNSVSKNVLFWNDNAVESIDVGLFFDNDKNEPWYEQYWNEVKNKTDSLLDDMMMRMDANIFLTGFNKFRSLLAKRCRQRRAYMNDFEIEVAALVLKEKGIILAVIHGSQPGSFEIGALKVRTEKTLHIYLSPRINKIAEKYPDPRKCIILLNEDKHYYYAHYTVVEETK